MKIDISILYNNLYRFLLKTIIMFNCIIIIELNRL